MRLSPPLAFAGLLACLPVASPGAAGDSTAWLPPAFSRLDSLFLAAATGEPRLKPVRDSSERALLALGDTTLDYLVRHRLTGQTPRQQHYVERLFTVLSDSGRNPSPRRVLQAALDASADTVRAQLLYIGSAIGDSAFLHVALPWLGSEAPIVRRNAWRSLGHYPHPGNRAELYAGLGATEGLERHQVLWALEKQREKPIPRYILPVLRDPYFFNRQKARDILLKSADSSWAVLESWMPRAPTPEERHEWRLLARESRGGEKFLRGQLMTREEKVFFGVGKGN